MWLAPLLALSCCEISTKSLRQNLHPSKTAKPSYPPYLSVHTVTLTMPSQLQGHVMLYQLTKSEKAGDLASQISTDLIDTLAHISSNKHREGHENIIRDRRWRNIPFSTGIIFRSF